MHTINRRKSYLGWSIPKVRDIRDAGSTVAIAVYEPSLKTNTRDVPLNRQTGFSLIELMVAITIGLIILLAITVLFSQVSMGFRKTDDATRALENGNFSLRVIGEGLRLAGFVGLSNDTSRIEPARSDRIAVLDTQNCGTVDWPFPRKSPSESNPGIEHLASPGSLPCIPSGAFLASSPAIVVRHATGIQVLPSEITASNRFFIQSGPTAGIVFMGKDYASEVKSAGKSYSVCKYVPSATAVCAPAPGCGCPLTNLGTVTRPDAPIFEYVTHIYYVRPCSRPAGATCAASDDGGQPIPTLVRRQLDESSPAKFVETPIAEGVERLSVAYGLDTTGDGTPDEYKSSPTVDELAQAVTARLSVLVRTRKRESGHDDTPFTYTLADGATFNCVANGAPCQHRRYLLNDTVVLKNYAYRR